MPQKTIYLCNSCGGEFLKWSGKCAACGEWNTLVKFTPPKASPASKSSGAVIAPLDFSKVTTGNFNRHSTGIGELDRVLGGGIVPGSVVLLGGDPGIGKSTLILQAAEAISKNGSDKVLYISGEESPEQVRMRADRLKLPGKNIIFLAQSDVDNITATISKQKPKLTIIDSVQAMSTADVPSGPGSIAQVKEVTNRLVNIAKSDNLPIILIGHVTKSGAVAGPKTLEHLVDVVLYLEGERNHQFRILRGIKNRFGSVNEAGVFNMGENGLTEVKNPSEIFIEEREASAPGTAIGVTFEGSRPFLLEIQSLASGTDFEYPKRSSVGFDYNRLQILVAVLTRRAGLKLANQDIYLNIAGGFRVNDPALDLPAALAIASASLSKKVDPELAAIGEIGLTGEIRSVSHLDKRVAEASKLGFKKILIPGKMNNIKSPSSLIRVTSIREAIRKSLT